MPTTFRPASEPATGELASRLRLALTRMARRLRQQGGGELTPSQLAALASIERHGPMTPSELADREQIQRPTATRVLALLEERGLISRAADPLDGRSSLLTVTREGAALLKKLRGRKTAYLAQHLSDLDSSDLRTLERAAAIIERILEEERR
jgi:DNA-binding MarR family transcriptional regulator